MSTKTLRILCCCICLLLAPYTRSVAQGPPQQGQGGADRDRPGGGPGNPGNRDTHDGPVAPKKSRPSDVARGKVTNPPHNALQFGPVGRWWDDKSVMQAIGLSRVQQKKMDNIFDANKPAILDSYKTFLKAQANLSAVNKDPQSDKTRVFAAIDAVNEARSSLQKATSAMLLQIRQEMEPAQIDKLQTVQ
jgi:Spy/CpxP family protein refolding chaperone